MDIRIITDSCCDLPEELLKQVEIVPMTLIFDGQDFKDGVELTLSEFYKKLNDSNNPPGSASPSAGDFLKAMADSEQALIFTVSSALSSSYNNARLAKDLYKKQFSDSLIHVFDSLNASIGQGLAIVKLFELIEKELSWPNIIKTLEEYIDGVKTYFILEKLDNLINSGRINRILGKIVSVLNIKLIMGKTSNGEIDLFEKIRGSRRAFKKLLKIVGQQGSNFEDRVLGIAHFNCLEKAVKFKEEAEKMYNFKNIIITKMGPTIATYADEGGLIISF